MTGEVVGDIINGERKAELLKDIAQRENIALEQIAVGDGANDLPMLCCWPGYCLRAKPIVKASARQSISAGLDSIIYLLGISDRERIAQAIIKTINSRLAVLMF